MTANFIHVHIAYLISFFWEIELLVEICRHSAKLSLPDCTHFF